MLADIPPKLLSLVYAAATDNGKWRGFCSELSRVLNAPIQMYGHSVRTHESIGLIGAGFDPSDLRSYHDYFAPLNPWMHMNLALPAGAVGVSDAALPRNDLQKTEFYNDWLRPQEDIVAGAAMICYRSEAKFIAMAVPCRARKVDDTLQTAQSVLESLSQHITQSIAMSAAFLNGGGSSMHHLESFPQGIILIQRSGRVGFINKAAEHALFDKNKMTLGYNGHLRAIDDDLDDHLENAVIAMQQEKYDQLLSPYMMSPIDAPMLVHSHRFPEEDELQFPGAVWNDPVIGAFLVAGMSGLAPQNRFDQIAKSMGASPAEARLAMALAEGLSLYQFADSIDLSRHTVRNQMRALLNKTATKNQADFIRKIHRLASPF